MTLPTPPSKTVTISAAVIAVACIIAVVVLTILGDDTMPLIRFGGLLFTNIGGVSVLASLLNRNARKMDQVRTDIAEAHAATRALTETRVCEIRKDLEDKLK